MGVYGKTKGTELESFVNMAVSAESMGGMMYYALSDIAERFGLKDVVEQLTGLGNQEMRHAGYYATLNGKYPGDTESFWKVIHGIGKAEFKGEERVNEFAAMLEEAGLADAASAVRKFALQERHHGEVIRAILAEHAPERFRGGAAPEGEPVYVCSCCGFEYVGDIGAEPANYTCPVCAAAKSAFKPGKSTD